MPDAKGGFRKGAEAVKSAIERASRQGGQYEDSKWFRLEDKERTWLRFLTDLDDLIEVRVHENVVKADGKRSSFVCRKDNPEDHPSVCELCDLYENAPDKKNAQARSRSVVYGLAVAREEVRDLETKQLQGYQDKVATTVDDSGEEKRAPVVYIVRQGTQNFWSFLIAFGERYGTLRDRDYDIQRRGKGLDTTYTIVPCDPLEISNIDERYANYTPDLESMLTRMSSQEYYDAKLRGETGDDNGESTPASQPVTEAVGLTGDDTVMDRLKAERENLQATAVSGSYE